MHIRGKDDILHKVVFEVRYRYGYTYLDRCGKTINVIMKEAPEWVVKAEQVNTQGVTLVSLANQCSLQFLQPETGFRYREAKRN